MKKAKFEIKDIMPIAITLVVAGIGIAYGLEVMGDVRDDNCAYGYDAGTQLCKNSTGQGNVAETSAEFNATKDAITGVAKLPAKLPMIVTVIVAAIIIGILVRYLMFKN